MILVFKNKIDCNMNKNGLKEIKEGLINNKHINNIDLGCKFKLIKKVMIYQMEDLKY